MKYLILILVFVGVNAFAYTPPPIPVVTMTPGAYDADVTRTVACKKWRQAPPALSEATTVGTTVLGYYGVTPAATNYELDWSIPRVLGGTDTADNVWPQHTSDVAVKNKLEKAIMNALCRSINPISIATARAAIDGDWTTGFRTYVSSATPTPTNTPIANTSTPTATATNTPTNTATNTPTNTATNTATPTP